MPSLRPPLAISGPDDFAEAFNVPHETIHRLTVYAELLAEWQTRHNLVSSKTIPELWQRHFADSAQLLALAPDAKSWLDLGSGAGFPGLVVAILAANQGTLRMHLVESTAKKCAFLAHVAQMTDTAVDIHCNRIEELGVRESIEPDVVSARALAPLPRLLELAAPFFRPGTRGLFLKGRDAEREIEAAKAHWHFTCRLHPSLTAADSPIVEVTELSKAKKGKPR
ncbi:MAG TPA: 16S rRNA (guanine(527)-N(7))-methyltransferase RsmG [Methyloceanibacter sp.]|jgi:16S rRNA (guanine527-N7)-methyltransferase|nr:16S rRNA (guanine(527)-N(7))-methyltransferase RsmG [Methyloceanibacter sp.]